MINNNTADLMMVMDITHDIEGTADNITNQEDLMTARDTKDKDQVTIMVPDPITNEPTIDTIPPTLILEEKDEEIIMGNWETSEDNIINNKRIRTNENNNYVNKK